MPAAITAGVLTWRSPRTLERTLASYRRHGLDTRLDERLCFVQEDNDEECRIAERYGWSVLTDAGNIGIGSAYRRLLDAAQGEHFLFLECDWRLLEAPAEQLAASCALLATGHTHLVRLRSRTRPGLPLGVLRWQNREHLRPGWLIESCFYEPRPWEIWPGVIDRDIVGDTTFVVTDATHATWSNTPHLARTEVLRRVLDLGDGDLRDIETTVAAHWGRLDVRVGHAPGMFTHDRIDGPAINRRDLRFRTSQRYLWATRGLRRRRRRRLETR